MPDGSVGGVVLATVNMNYFRLFYERFSIGEKGAIFIANGAGILLLRRPFDESLLGRDISQFPMFHDYLPKSPVGTAAIKSRVDGVTRINSYRRIEECPLVLSAALSQEEVLAEWRLDAVLQNAVGGVLVLLIGFIG
ncbi:hypothetical protein ACQ4WP_02515 [Janthinobacterium sp. GB4P2]|uniref:hypothetical protein n=1 Tax=Janthinobacterium sp. GB4P2 TaxID=3424189 RepID=UPI003F207B83